MKLTGVGLPGGDSLALHPGVTVVGGLDGPERARWLGDLAAAVLGRASGLSVEVEVAGATKVMTGEVARSLGLEGSVVAVSLAPDELPGAAPPAEGPGEGAGEAVARAEAAVAAREAEVAVARHAHAQAVSALGPPDPAPPTDEGALAGARRRLAEAEAALGGARGEAERAAASLAEARRSEQAALDLEAARRSEVAAKLTALGQRRQALETELEAAAALLAKHPRPGDLAALEKAMTGLRRLRAVKPRHSRAAAALLERWLTVRAAMAERPDPPEAAQWLVEPALRALLDARRSLAEAEAGARPPDAGSVAAVEEAHAAVLEAEKRVMRKGSRLNRRRLDEAAEAEASALAALGVSTYSLFLQRFGGGGQPAADPVDAARAALSDAEAVWVELHGGDAPVEWTALREEELVVRVEAEVLLGREVPADELEEALRSHRETVVDASWAEGEVADALAGAGCPPVEDPGEDVFVRAERWLAEVPALSRTRAELEAEVARLEAELASVSDQLAGHQADEYFGAEGPDGASPRGSEEELFDTLEDGVRKTRAAEDEAAAAVEAARREVEDERQRLESEVGAASAAVETATAALDEARASLDRANLDAAAAAARPTPGPDLGGVMALEAELYLVARLTALRAHPAAGPLPLIVDAGAVSGLPDGAASRLLDLLALAAAGGQVVVLGDDGPVAGWADGLGRARASRQRIPAATPATERTEG